MMDAWTEFISSADDEDIQEQGGELEKFPATQISIGNTIFCRHDFSTSGFAGRRLNEVIIEDYEWDTFVVSKYECRHHGIDLEKILAKIESCGKKYRFLRF